MKYLGTPYRRGGTSPAASTAAALSTISTARFLDKASRACRTTWRARACRVARSDLKRGDLVFFGYRGTFTHVGIYAGNGQFVHATHRGSPVQVTALDGDYYRDRYMTAVRLSPR